MKVRTSLVCCAVAMFAASVGSAGAQSDKDVAAWFALSLTPVGAFPTIVVPAGTSGTQRLPAWAFRATSWKFDGATDRNYSLGGSYVAPVGVKSTFTGTLGYFKPGGAGNSATIMGGGDLQSPFWESVAAANDPMTFSAS